MIQVVLASENRSEAEQLSALAGPRFQIKAVGSEDLERDLVSADGCEIAVGALFPKRWLDAAKQLHSIVLPFAGVPLRTRQALASFPEIVVYNSHYNAAYTAEHAWALLLAAAKRIVPGDRCLRQNDWSHRYEDYPSFILHRRTLLLIGYGAIGKHLGQMGKAFGMRVWAVKRTAGEAPEIDRLATAADLSELLPAADAIILSLPETESTTGILGPEAFACMKPGVLLVNVGRGSAIDQDAFHDALRAGRIGGAGIDTWWVYPRTRDDAKHTAPSRHPLSEFDNLVFSPHRASNVLGHDDEQLAHLATILNAIVDGRPPRAVDRTEWY